MEEGGGPDGNNSRSAWTFTHQTSLLWFYRLLRYMRIIQWEFFFFFFPVQQKPFPIHGLVHIISSLFFFCFIPKFFYTFMTRCNIFFFSSSQIAPLTQADNWPRCCLLGLGQNTSMSISRQPCERVHQIFQPSAMNEKIRTL